MIKKIKKIIVLLLIITNLQFSYAYELTQNDEIFINSITSQVLEKPESYQLNFLNKLDTLILNWNYSEKINTVLIKIYNNLNKLHTEEIIENEVFTDELNNISEEEYYLDLDVVKNNWLGWNNQTREILWLDDYVFHQTLEDSAKVWSNSALEKWEINHERNQWDGFYNYQEITKWFADNWVECENIEWITHTENIWWWAYFCNDWECNEELTEAMYRAYTAYIDEKWTDSDAHYRSLTNQYFRNIWLWITINETQEDYYEYYLTIHYCT